MRRIYGDLHIHIGQAGGKPVKITASRKLDLYSILFVHAPRKGLEMVGVVDAGSPLVSYEITQMLADGVLKELPGGGFLASSGVLLIAGSEVESREGIHSVLYFPTLASIHKFQQYMQSRIKNMCLSTQKARVSLPELINLSIVLDAAFCPAHVFTPHKGIYGSWTPRITQELGREAAMIKTIELGLSADTDMADLIAETRGFTFISNSDAHSGDKIGREYNLFRMGDKNFLELKYCLENHNERRILANYGMDPRLGKYHRSYCPACDLIMESPPPVLTCPQCGRQGLVTGVLDRVVSISDYDESRHPVGRPQYNYRVPLRELPGVGPGLEQKLLAFAGSEISLLEEASLDDIKRLAGESVAAMIGKMRLGRLEIIPGGGGQYGKVKKDNCQQ